MGADQDKLRATALAVVAAFFLAFVIFFYCIKQLFANRKCICYLFSEFKPQHAFQRVLADNSYSEFKHLKLQETDSQSDGVKSNLHPYEAEINNLMKNPDVGFLEFIDGCEKRSMEMEGSYVWVETESQLRDLVEVLNNEKVFAVDTEQHSERSFLGFTSLVQISTMSKDYLVDAIILHDVMGLLRPVFANPGICKVFHGAGNDVIWLQRDFHIYVVNLFDTAKACDTLSKPQKSLAYLLETYCSVATNKLLQREDWRRRPLTEEMIHYARADSHYLMYIAYCLCLELKQLKNDSKGKSASENPSPGDNFHFLLEASRRSNETCLQRFAKHIEACPGEKAASSIVTRLNDQGNITASVFSAKSQEIVWRLCLWRDVMARLHDESPRFVLLDDAITRLATEIPTTETDICSCISIADLDVESPSAVVYSHLEDLLCLLQDNTASLYSIFQIIIKRHLGPAGSCPLSAYNHALLSKVPLGLTNRITSGHNGFGASKTGPKEAGFSRPFYQKIFTQGSCLSKVPRFMFASQEQPINVFEDKDGHTPDNFDIQSKKNICVGCGAGEHHALYNIIPPCYRRHFPLHLKSGRSPDIVLMCMDCHGIAHAAAEKHKKEIAAKLKIPLFVGNIVDVDEPQSTPASSLPVVSSKKVRTAAISLLRHRKFLPPQRCEEYRQILVTHYGRSEITDEDLKKAQLVGLNPHGKRKFEKKRGFNHMTKDINLDDDIGGETPASIENASEGHGPHGKQVVTHLLKELGEDGIRKDINLDDDIGGETPASIENASEGHGPHGKQVVTHLLKELGEDGIREFCQRWRQVFLEAVHPRFLSGGWDVKRSAKRDFGQFFLDKRLSKEASATAAAV